MRSDCPPLLSTADEISCRSPRLRGFVQTSLPSLAMVGFNAFLPFFLDALSVFQGLPARSWIEYSLLKKCVLFPSPSQSPSNVPFSRRYHLSILFTTLFVFVRCLSRQPFDDAC